MKSLFDVKKADLLASSVYLLSIISIGYYYKLICFLNGDNTFVEEFLLLIIVKILIYVYLKYDLIKNHKFAASVILVLIGVLFIPVSSALIFGPKIEDHLIHNSFILWCYFVFDFVAYILVLVADYFNWYKKEVDENGGINKEEIKNTTWINIFSKDLQNEISFKKKMDYFYKFLLALLIPIFLVVIYSSFRYQGVFEFYEFYWFVSIIYFICSLQINNSIPIKRENLSDSKFVKLTYPFLIIIFLWGFSIISFVTMIIVKSYPFESSMRAMFFPYLLNAFAFTIPIYYTILVFIYKLKIKYNVKEIPVNLRDPAESEVTDKFI